MHLPLFLCLVAVNFPIYSSIRVIFFENKDDFRSALRALLTPNLFNFMRPREEMMEEFKAFGFLVSCATLIFAQYLLVSHFIF